jgi:hypothetical protein
MDQTDLFNFGVNLEEFWETWATLLAGQVVLRCCYKQTSLDMQWVALGAYR